MKRTVSGQPIALATAVKLAVVLCVGGAAQANSSGFDDIAKMVEEGTAKVDFRYRYEGVEQEGFDKDANASTLRSRLTLTSASVGGFSAQLEFDDVTSVGSDDYNSTANGNSEYPIVADPEGTDFNQAWLAYSTESWNTKLGRQRIINGSQRFIGGVAWRQNEQTYDGLRLQAKPIDGLSIDASYVNNINRIFGPNDAVQPAEWEGNNGFLRAAYDISKAHTLSGFAYVIDVEAQSGYSAAKTINNSTSTVGIAYKGKFFDWLGVDASWATQSDSGDSELDYDADYYMAELNGSFKPVAVKIGYEVLAAGEDKNTGLNVGFKTPLATLHKFQGWADKFLGTPADGIEDAYVGISGKVGPVKLGAYYHDFKAESASTDYGTELNLVATLPINKQLTLQAKYADYDAKDLATDTTKFWFTAQLKL